MFIDKVRIRARAGDGGNGCVSFRREKYIEYGGPDGGNGGKGGDVILAADANVQDLMDFYYSPRVAAGRGGHGRGKNCSGRSGSDVVLRVPIGTQVFRVGEVRREAQATRYHPAAATEAFSATASVGFPHRQGRRAQGPSAGPADTSLRETADNTTASPSQRELVADLVENGQRWVLAGGGRGGRGNNAYKSSTLRAPRDFEYGEPGEGLTADLELKTLADVGLVGYPNAGKSTLVSQITHAHPKIAPYPFTTLNPKVGVITDDDLARVRIADIPGLIDGAHVGKGLGHDFLRHVERCQLLVILLDMAGVDGRSPTTDYTQLLEEMKLYNPALPRKPRLVVANKMDLPAAKRKLAAFKRRHHSLAVIEISAQTGTGLGKLKLAIRRRLP
ncbi:GTPase ObgE [bacterium]|nr:GTPase ObgE [bacterium]